MADYKTLHGTNIDSVSSDPSNPINGQVWYNSTSFTLKAFTSNPTGSWAAGNNMNTARRTTGGIGIQTAALFAGGQGPNTAKTEQYDGSSWTEVGDLVSGARYGMRGFGSVTAGIIAGGYPPTSGGTVTESWNGASWTEVADLNTGRSEFAGAGTTTAGLAFGGQTGSPNVRTAGTEEWDVPFESTKTVGTD